MKMTVKRVLTIARTTVYILCGLYAAFYIFYVAPAFIAKQIAGF
jgi:hypothetical protein